MHDAHIHIHDKELVTVMNQHHIPCLVNASTPTEYMFLKELQKFHPMMKICAGIHPWSAQQLSMQDMKDVLDEVSFIGEIGMDSVWCDVDLQIQKDMLIKQLEYASNHQLPVILHTKGMEEEILSCIKQYKNTYLVHWYSCKDHLQGYIEEGCYFTIGVSVGVDDAVSAVATHAPLNRILLETDGMDAVEWAWNQKVSYKEYPEVLKRSLKTIASIRNMDVEALEKQMDENYQRFIKLGKNR